MQAGTTTYLKKTASASVQPLMKSFFDLAGATPIVEAQKNTPGNKQLLYPGDGSDPVLHENANQPTVHIRNTNGGLNELIQMMNSVSIKNLKKTIKSIKQDVKEHKSPRAIRTNHGGQLANFRRLAVAYRHFNELAAELPREKGLIGESPLPRRFQETSELVKVLRDIDQNLANSSALKYSLREGIRLCNELKDFSVDAPLPAAFMLDSYRHHAIKLLSHRVLRDKKSEVTTEDFDELRKSFRKILFFTRVNLLTQATPDIVALHNELNAVTSEHNKVRYDRDRNKRKQNIAEQNSTVVKVSPELLERTSLALQGVLDTIHNITLLSNKASPIAGINHEGFNDLLEKIVPKHQHEKLWKVELAYNISKSAHQGVYRKGGLYRYFDHVRDVTLILLLEAGITDPDLLAAGLLHDVVEDSPILGNVILFGEDVSREQAHKNLTRMFGRRVADAVLTVTKKGKTGDPAIDQKNKEEYMQGLAFGDDLALLVKMADRLHNLRTLPEDDRKFCKRQLTETIDEYLPIFAKYLDRASPRYRKGAEKLYESILEELGNQSAKFTNEEIGELWDAVPLRSTQSA